jgi:protein required for attachment to host cells
MKFCVVVANGSRARFFYLKRPELTDLNARPRLLERGEIFEPELQERGQDLWTERTGMNRGAGSGSHSYDDHRNQHQAEFEKRFTKQIADHAVKLIRSSAAHSVVVCGAQRQLPLLKNILESKVNGVHIQQLAKDLLKLDAHALYEYLHKEGMLPPQSGQ